MRPGVADDVQSVVDIPKDEQPVIRVDVTEVDQIGRAGGRLALRQPRPVRLHHGVRGDLMGPSHLFHRLAEVVPDLHGGEGVGDVDRPQPAAVVRGKHDMGEDQRVVQTVRRPDHRGARLVPGGGAVLELLLQQAEDTHGLGIEIPPHQTALIPITPVVLLITHVDHAQQASGAMRPHRSEPVVGISRDLPRRLHLARLAQHNHVGTAGDLDRRVVPLAEDRGLRAIQRVRIGIERGQAEAFCIWRGRGRRVTVGGAGVGHKLPSRPQGVDQAGAVEHEEPCLHLCHVDALSVRGHHGLVRVQRQAVRRARVRHWPGRPQAELGRQAPFGREMRRAGLRASRQIHNPDVHLRLAPAPAAESLDRQDSRGILWIPPQRKQMGRFPFVVEPRHQPGLLAVRDVIDGEPAGRKPRRRRIPEAVDRGPLIDHQQVGAGLDAFASIHHAGHEIGDRPHNTRPGRIFHIDDDGRLVSHDRAHIHAVVGNSDIAVVAAGNPHRRVVPLVVIEQRQMRHQLEVAAKPLRWDPRDGRPDSGKVRRGFGCGAAYPRRAAQEEPHAEDHDDDKHTTHCPYEPHIIASPFDAAGLCISL